jgi:hypothetical protein
VGVLIVGFDFACLNRLRPQDASIRDGGGVPLAELGKCDVALCHEKELYAQMVEEIAGAYRWHSNIGAGPFGLSRDDR